LRHWTQTRGRGFHRRNEGAPPVRQWRAEPAAAQTAPAFRVFAELFDSANRRNTLMLVVVYLFQKPSASTAGQTGWPKLIRVQGLHLPAALKYAFIIATVSSGWAVGVFSGLRTASNGKWQIVGRRGGVFCGERLYRYPNPSFGKLISSALDYLSITSCRNAYHASRGGSCFPNSHSAPRGAGIRVIRSAAFTMVSRLR